MSEKEGPCHKVQEVSGPHVECTHTFAAAGLPFHLSFGSPPIIAHFPQKISPVTDNQLHSVVPWPWVKISYTLKALRRHNRRPAALASS